MFLRPGPKGTQSKLTCHTCTYLKATTSTFHQSDKSIISTEICRSRCITWFFRKSKTLRRYAIGSGGAGELAELRGGCCALATRGAVNMACGVEGKPEESRAFRFWRVTCISYAKVVCLLSGSTRESVLHLESPTRHGLHGQGDYIGTFVSRRRMGVLVAYFLFGDNISQGL